MASEQFIQFVWKHRLHRAGSLTTTCGLKLEILHPGEQNQHAGPDFFNARIRMDRLTWAGNVEIHHRSSDWYRHRHHLDAAYNNVILHVVEHYDTDVTNSLGRRIPTLISRCHAKLLKRYDSLKRSESWLPCAYYIRSFPESGMKLWLRSLYKERMAHKSRYMDKILLDSARNPDEALYQAMARGYGTPMNSLPFEMLAKKIPLPVLMDFRDNVKDLEAILFGHSGLLSPARDLGPYPSSLWQRYSELRPDLTGPAVPAHLWRFFRLRPPSFPTLRISEFASFIHHRFPFSESILNITSINEVEQTFRLKASEYWTTHYLFGICSPPLPKYPGEQFIATLLINVLVPFLLALERGHGPNPAGLSAGDIIAELRSEHNQILKNWGIFGVRACNAMESQALLHLYQFYCKQKRCLECHIGAHVVSAPIHEKN
jgi:hypothetical protein